MVNRFFQNARRPKGFLGGMMLRRMNRRHQTLADWGFSHYTLPSDASVLDIGCGGGANLERLLKLCPTGMVTGVDYSPKSVAMSRRKNAHAIQNGRCRVLQGDAMALPFQDPALFDGITACETVYFWPDLSKGLSEIFRVLKPGGKVLILCELSNPLDTVWQEKVGNMEVYSAEELASRLRSVGFEGIETHRNNEQWIALVAQKPTI